MLIFCSSWIFFFCSNWKIQHWNIIVLDCWDFWCQPSFVPESRSSSHDLFIHVSSKQKKKKCPCLSFYICEMGFLKPKLSELLAVLENILRVQALLVWHSAEVTVWSRGTGSPWPCPWLTQESFRTFLVSFSLGHTVLHPISSSTPSNPSCPPQPVKTIVQSNLFPKKF